MRKRDLKLKPEPEDGKEKFSLSLPTDVAQPLAFYKELLGAKSMNYIIVEAIRSFLEGDKSFQKLYAEHKAGGAAQAGSRRPDAHASRE